MKPEELLSEAQKRDLVSAVKEAEKNTSGEIRIHIDASCPGDPVRYAGKVFKRLGMENTENRNGVLIYLATESRVFAIIGDKGINEAVPQGFWNDVSSSMAENFRRGRFVEGLKEAVLMSGEKLKAYFPYAEDDVNEQSDDISFGQNSTKTQETE